MIKENRILIFSSLSEPCTANVVHELEEIGASTLVINYEEALLRNLWTIHIKNGSDTSCDIKNNNIHSFFPTAVWMRRWGFPIYPSTFDDFSLAFSFSEISSTLNGAQSILNNCLWINDPERERLATNKIKQLRLAKELGLLIPKTLITNDPNQVINFYKTTNRVIFKPVSASQITLRTFNKGAYNSLNPVEKDLYNCGKEISKNYLYTKELTDEIMESISSVKWSPAIFQERINKQSDIRVTFINNMFFSCEILSQIRDDTSTDFRFMNVSGLLPHKLIDLPSIIENKLKLLMNKLGLIFGCIDLVLDENGNFIFLEVNPSGQWLWIEQITGAPISKCLAKTLCGMSLINEI